MIKELVKLIKVYFSGWKWNGPTGCQGSTGCTGYTGISLNEWKELIDNKEK